MRVLPLIVASVVVGGFIGFAVTEYQLRRWTLVSNATEARAGDAMPPSAEPASQGAPEASVDAEEHLFGSLEFGQTGSHEFLITNTGTAPLQLTQGGTSCACASSLFEGGMLPPGESAPVRVEWKASDTPGPFEQYATIYTNDPRRSVIRLTVKGRYTAPLDAKPREIIISSVTAGIESFGEARLFCFIDPEFQITGHEVQDPTHFDVTFQPLAADQLEDGAMSGVAVRVHVKPGLPVGPFQQTVRLKTNVERAAEYELKVQGMVQSQITVFGPHFHRDTGSLRVGQLDGRSETRRTILIRSGGPSADDVQFEVAQVRPTWLGASLEEMPASADRGARLIQLHVVVPKDAPACNFMGDGSDGPGEVLIRTTDPQVPMIKILVEFAVAR